MRNDRFVQTVIWDDEPKVAGGAGSGNFGHAGRPGAVGGSSSGTPTQADLIAKFKDLPRGYIGGLFASDTVIELTVPRRYTEERAAEFARIEAASGMNEALRAMDSEKDWGGGWIGATDEWQAAQALGGSNSIPKSTKEIITEGMKKTTGFRRDAPLSPKDLDAFRERRKMIQEELAKKYPSGEIEVFRGITGVQSRLLDERLGLQANLGVHALSSWTLNADDAHQFATGKSGKAKGHVLKTTISIKDVWTTGEHAMKNSIIRIADQHGEIVVLSSGKTRKVHVIQ